MPKLRGPELASRLRLRYPGMPVIYMSGYGKRADAGWRVERNTVLREKPFTANGILEVIREMNVGCTRLGWLANSIPPAKRPPVDSLRLFAVTQND
jgi:hypothetical protein